MGFYHWKTQFAPTDFEKNFLTQTATSQLYVRLFDVDIDPQTGFVKPIAALLGAEKMQNLPYPITPVVFLTNRTFQNLSDQQVDSLAGLVAQKIRFYTEGGVFELKIKNSKFKTQDLTGLEIKNSKFKAQDLTRTSGFSSQIQFDCDWTVSTRDRFLVFEKIKH